MSYFSVFSAFTAFAVKAGIWYNFNRINTTHFTTICAQNIHILRERVLMKGVLTQKKNFERSLLSLCIMSLLSSATSFCLPQPGPSILPTTTNKFQSLSKKKLFLTTTGITITGIILYAVWKLTEPIRLGRALAKAAEENNLAHVETLITTITQNNSNFLNTTLSCYSYNPIVQSTNFVLPGYYTHLGSALGSAAHNGHAECMEKIMQFMRTSHITGNFGLEWDIEFCLQNAAAQGHDNCIEKILDFEPTILCSSIAQLSLLRAAEQGHLHCIEKILTNIRQQEDLFKGERYLPDFIQECAKQALQNNHPDCAEALSLFIPRHTRQTERPHQQSTNTNL